MIKMGHKPMLKFGDEYYNNSRNWYGRKVRYNYYEKAVKLMIEYVLRKIDVKGKHVLMVGIGYGYEAEVLQKKGAIITGIDISNHAIGICKQRLQGTFFVHDIEKPLPNNKKYDIMLAISVMEHLQNPAIALLNIHHALKDGGILIIVTPNGMSPYSIYDKKRDKTHIGIRTKDEWLKIFNMSSWSSIKIHSVQWIPVIWKLVRMPFGSAIIINATKDDAYENH